jgi:hypothetical protein
MLEAPRTITRAAPVATDANPQSSAGLNAAVRQLLARLSQGAPARRAAPARPTRSIGAVWETRHGHRPPLDEETGDAKDAFAARQASARRAEAHAAFRIAQGSEQAALDAALAVVEAEVARLRDTVLVYGEALKSIQVYASDEEARGTAAVVLRKVPERLRASPPAPRFHRAHPGAEAHG